MFFKKKDPSSSILNIALKWTNIKKSYFTVSSISYRKEQLDILITEHKKFDLAAHQEEYSLSVRYRNIVMFEDKAVT